MNCATLVDGVKSEICGDGFRGAQLWLLLSFGARFVVGQKRVIAGDATGAMMRLGERKLYRNT